jgi:hypothetical protein
MIRTRWDTFQGLRNAQDETALTDQINRMLAHSLGQSGQQQKVAALGTHSWAPALGIGTHSWASMFDVSERDDAYLAAAELHGVEVGNFRITFEDGLAAIQSEQQLAHAS